MRYIFTLIVLTCSLFSSPKSVLDQFPNSDGQVESKAKSVLAEFDIQYAEFIKQSHRSATFDSVITGWNRLIYPAFHQAAIFSYLPLITQNGDLLKSAGLESKLIAQKLFSSMNNEKALDLVIDFANNAVKLSAITPYERYELGLVLETALQTPSAEKVKETLSRIKHLPSANFCYQKGEHKEKNLPHSNKLSVLSWNVCCLEGLFPMLFGGVLPWKDRIDRIAGKITELDPDVLCLQEVFSKAANTFLLEKLRKKYSHFYFNIGPNPAGFSVERLGIPSGLFIASKYPLEKASFTSYNDDQTPLFRRYGFFSAYICNKGETLARLITTHLQPGGEEKDGLYRKNQMAALSGTIRGEKAPVVLCGDLNTVKGTEEATNLFSNYTSSSYTGIDWTCCELRDYWWKASQNTEAFGKLPPNKEWLDYFFILKNEPGKRVTLATKILIASDLSKPEDALSDHQILFTDVTLYGN